MSSKYLSVSEAAEKLGLPGPWTLRRLEGRGVLPPPKRSSLSGERYYYEEELTWIARTLSTVGWRPYKRIARSSHSAKSPASST